MEEVKSHIVKSFDADLSRLERTVTEMGGLVEQQIEDAAQALRTRDRELSDKVIEQDRKVDLLEEQLNNDVVRMLALRQPQAMDLRAVVVALKIGANLERIGDYAKNMAKRNRVLIAAPNVEAPAVTVGRMGEMVREMINDAINAYHARDAAKAEDIRQRDEDVDQLHNTLFRELLTYMMEDPRAITPCMHLLFIAKNLERMGDHATSIAEQVTYMVTGEKPGEPRPKSDNTAFVNVDPSA